MEFGLRADVFGGLLGGDAVASESAEPLAENAAVKRAAAPAVAIAGVKAGFGVSVGIGVCEIWRLAARITVAA